jgi:hypothetical protein
MAAHDQLEIIGPDGEIRFYDLDAAKGITNIGRHPHNDLVLDSPGVADFHAVLDHQQRPYQIMLLAERAETRLDGQPLPANAFRELHEWDTLEIDGYSLLLLQGVEAPARPPATPAPTPEPPATPAPARPKKATPAAQPAAAVPAGRDQADEVIVTELSAREWVVDVEQTATCQLTIVNGGSIVATFAVAVEGVPADWMTLSPPRVNLNEGARATVSIAFSPPRLPTSRAGAHRLVIVVTSANYPGHVSRISGTLVINPYYAFSLGEMSPKQQTVSWRKATGQVTLPITNEGNSETPFRLDGEDEERACRFEFQTPGETASLVRQAEVRLSPDQTLTVPIAITPLRRRLVALRKRNYSFTITTTMIESTGASSTMPRSIMGRLSAKALIGPWLLLLILVGLAALVGFLARPVGEPLLASDNQTPSHGEQITLTYNASRFPTLSPLNLLNGQNTLFLHLTLEFKPRDGTWQPLKTSSELEAPNGLVTDVPVEDGHYRLRAENWLSALIPALAGSSREVPVDVEPVEPQILVFRPDQERVYVGQEVAILWTVTNADSLKLSYDDASGPIEEDLQGDELATGRRSFVCTKDTTFTLTAANSSGSEPVRKSVRVMVLAEPVPTPVIVRFDVDPLEITVGDTVRIGWEVTGADSVSIKPVGDGLPLKGDVGDQPQSLTTYQLIASKTGADGTQAENKSLLKEVVVNPLPTPTLAPSMPVIDLFEATPKEVIAGKAEVVELTWSVAGATTDIEITTADLAITGLASQDTVTVTVNETTLFVLTASNGELKTSKAVEVKANEPTPTPTLTPTPEPTLPPEPTPTPEPTATPYPPPIISYFTAEAKDPTEDRVVFKTSYDSANGPVYVYEVQASSYVKLGWGVKGADVVILENLGPQPAEGSLELPDAVVAATSIMLTAENNDSQNQVFAFLQFEITSPPAPPPPSYVTGVEDSAGGTNRIIWNYSQDDRDQIDGFRIYRADVPPGTDFAVVSPVIDPTVSEWSDQVSPTCGKGYYVVAVYTDPVSGAEQETAASQTSWYSRSCP